MLFARVSSALVLALVASPAFAAPIDAEAGPADPYELAVRWTLASVSPRELPVPTAEPSAVPALRIGALPHAGAAQGGVPEPAAYAAMGLLLLGAGLLARRFSAPRARPGQR